MGPTASAATAEMGFYSNGALNSKDPEKVAGMFEAMFYRILLSQAREASSDDGLFDSAAMKQVQGMYDDELAQYMGAQGSLGIKELMMEHIEKRREAVQPAVDGTVPGMLKAPQSKEI